MGAWMGGIIRFLYAFGGQVGVNLSGAQTLVPQHFLNRPQVRPMIQHVRGKAVPQGMRADVRIQVRLNQVLIQLTPH